MHKYILLKNNKWLMNEHMSTMQMIYIGNFKNQQYDQHLYLLI
jgi:hypothetical protein